MVAEKDWFLKHHGITLLINPDVLPSGNELAIDVETDEKDNPISLAVCGDTKSVSVYFGLSGRDKLFEELKNRQLIAHNAKSDIGWLERYGLSMQNVYWDSMLAEYVLESTADGFGLKELANKFFGFKWPSYVQITSQPEFLKEACEANPELWTKKVKIYKSKPSVTELKLPKRIPLYLHPQEQIANYTGMDAYACFMLKQSQARRMTEMSGRFMKLIEFPTSAVLHEVERQGIGVNTDTLLKIHKKFLRRMYRAKKLFLQYVGTDVMVSSPVQVLKALRKRHKGITATNEDALVPFKFDRVVKLLFAYRGFAKICNTYTKVLYKKGLQSPNSRVHCEFLQHTDTGRLASRGPNLQNQPPELREAFVAKEGYTFVNADWSQIELRMPAHYSGDPLFVDTFINAKKKFHQVTADAIGKSYKVGKTVNFLLTNGGGPKRLAEVAEIPYEEAESAFNEHKEKFKTYWNWVAQEVRLAHRQGGVYTLYGRFIPIPNLKDRNYKIVGRAERQAISGRIQGSCADMMKAAMIKLWRKYGLIPVVTVHDELMYETPIHNAEKVAYQIREVMEGIVKLRVPLVADIGIGKTWEEAKGD